jgi:hypothetical protein
MPLHTVPSNHMSTNVFDKTFGVRGDYLFGTRVLYDHYDSAVVVILPTDMKHSLIGC